MKEEWHLIGAVSFACIRITFLCIHILLFCGDGEQFQGSTGYCISRCTVPQTLDHFPTATRRLNAKNGGPGGI